MSNPLKKTMVFLGLAEDDLDQNSTQATAVADQVTQAQQPLREKAEKTAPVTPLRKITPTRQPVMQSMNEILTVHPEKYGDAKLIAESFRDDVPVIMNLSRMGDGDAKRIIDFASGLVMGLNGHIERVTGKVFLLTPSHIAPKSETDYLGEYEADSGSANDSGSFFVSAAQ